MRRAVHGLALVHAKIFRRGGAQHVSASGCSAAELQERMLLNSPAVLPLYTSTARPTRKRALEPASDTGSDSEADP